MRRTRMLRRAQVPERARHHVRLVTRLLMAQASAAAVVTLPFSRRNTPVVMTTLMLVATLFLLAALAHTGTQAARTVVLSVEISLVLFGLLRFFSYRYVGGTVFAIVVTAVLLHPAVARAYGAAPGLPAGQAGNPGAAVRGEGGALGAPGKASVSDPAGGAFGESAGG